LTITLRGDVGLTNERFHVFAGSKPTSHSERLAFTAFSACASLSTQSASTAASALSIAAITVSREEMSRN
jgi:hypothetical protein